jgi:hypothetical protein
MSDTPLTDAAKEGGESWMELAALSAVLERENAALRVALDQQANYQRELRADRDRLDWVCEHLFTTRSAIDAKLEEKP